MWRWMPVWSWEEIKAAGVHIFGQQESEFRERYERWLGIPRYVLDLLDEAYQNSLDRAIDQCSLEIMAESFTSFTAHKQMSHKLVHVQVQKGYLEGPTKIAGGYIVERLIAKYVQAKDSDEHFLAAWRQYRCCSIQGQNLREEESIPDPVRGRLIHVL